MIDIIIPMWVLHNIPLISLTIAVTILFILGVYAWFYLGNPLLLYGTLMGLLMFGGMMLIVLLFNPGSPIQLINITVMQP